MRFFPFHFRRLLLKVAAIALLGIGVIIAATAALTRWECRRPRTLPQPSGHYEVGRRFFAFRDIGRNDPLSPVPDAKRELLVCIWYPASTNGNELRAEYAPDRGRSARDWTEQRLDQVHAHAYESAAFSNSQPQFPVLLFSPGSGQLPTAYTALAEDLASHGYVVVALAHTFSTPNVRFPDGHVARVAESRFHGGLGDFLVSVWAADLVSTLDFLRQRQQAGDSFFGHLALQQAGVLGHSFGGAAAAEACLIDQRFRACIDLDGTVYGPVVNSGLKQPLLLFVQKLLPPPKLLRARRENFDKNQAREDSLFEHSCSAVRLTVPKLSHMNISDQAFFFEAEDRFAELIGTRMDGPETLTLTSSTIRAFFSQHLLQLNSPRDEFDGINLRGSRLEVHKRC